MQAFAGAPDDDQDSALVRTTFRLLVRHGVLLAFVLALLHSLFFWRHGDASWRLTGAVGLLLLPLYPLLSTRRSYPVFLFGLIAFLTLVLAALSVQTLRYGSSADYHVILIALAPTAIVAGRIGMAAKWTLIVAIGALLYWLDRDPATALRLSGVDPEVMTKLRLSNLAVTMLILCSLTQRYFQIVVAAQRRLTEFASIDPLTGLHNRRHFMATAAQELARSERYGGRLCLVLADLDHFKSINDRLGHDAGDTVLRQVSHVIRGVARNADCVCRWGGEEFLVLLPQTDLDGAANIAERMRQQVSDSAVAIAQGQQPLRVTMTLGVAMLNPGEAFDAAVRRADRALYAGKAAGRNCAVLAAA